MSLNGSRWQRMAQARRLPVCYNSSVDETANRQCHEFTM
nr:MAG TPA: hypothetical protein [Caudoviricetes sp.]